LEIDAGTRWPAGHQPDGPLESSADTGWPGRDQFGRSLDHNAHTCGPAWHQPDGSLEDRPERPDDSLVHASPLNLGLKDKASQTRFLTPLSRNVSDQTCAAAVMHD
jgi:hypothetical protein